jgi:hypothetical protein
VLFFLADIIDFGFLFHHDEVVTNAAREGARMKSTPWRFDQSGRHCDRRRKQVVMQCPYQFRSVAVINGFFGLHSGWSRLRRPP